MSPEWIAFIAGAFVGGSVGVVAMALMTMASRADDAVEAVDTGRVA